MSPPERASRLGQTTQRVLRFLAVGGSATALQYGLLVLLVEAAGSEKLLAAVAAYALAALANYALNYYFTFSASGRVGHSQALPRFVFVALVGLAINTLCFSLLLPFAHYLIAQVCATAVTLAFNFLLHQFWIYGVRP
ncbi:GtrA family protein [uncultured Microbulbifer sp.]|uniref:GtrA family protein n=1 Tax=uncultured Microbulbifer sp. TaxID=348147 RepID=UPI0025E7E312|nr:GtrA family protein [uncultured Microbulbifer sp.]